jgi:hypothetical protein
VGACKGKRRKRREKKGKSVLLMFRRQLKISGQHKTDAANEGGGMILC